MPSAPAVDNIDFFGRWKGGIAGVGWKDVTIAHSRANHYLSGVADGRGLRPALCLGAAPLSLSRL